MPRPHPRRGRRRPGRRPTCRPPAVRGPSRPEGFTGPGFRQIYRWLLPGLAGAEKRRHFNEVSLAIVAAAGLGGGALGLACFGWPGALIGLGWGIAAGGSLAESRGFYRG